MGRNPSPLAICVSIIIFGEDGDEDEEEWTEPIHASSSCRVIVINHDSRNSDELLMGQNDM